MLGILNGDFTEQLTAGHDIAGVLLRCGFLMTLSIGAWQDMRNHRIKLSLIVMSGAGERFCDVCILCWMRQSYTGIGDARYLWTWCRDRL